MEFAAPQKLHRILKNRKLHVSTICTTVSKHRIGQKSRIQPPGISMAFSIWIFICAVNCLKNLSCIYSLCMDVYSASLLLSRSCPLSWLFAKELVHPSLPEPARCNRTTSQTPLRFSPYLTSLWRCDDGWIFSHVPTRNLPKASVNLENRLLKNDHLQQTMCDPVTPSTLVLSESKLSCGVIGWCYCTQQNPVCTPKHIKHYKTQC